MTGLVLAFENPRQPVDVDPLADRFRATARRLGWADDELAEEVAERFGWEADKGGARGVLVLLGLAVDGLGARRPLMRAYRAVQVYAALDLIHRDATGRAL